MVSGVGRGMGVLDGVVIVEGEGAVLEVNLGRPIVTFATRSSQITLRTCLCLVSVGERRGSACRYVCTFSSYRVGYIHGVPIKNNPLGKIIYLCNGSKFFHEIYSFYRVGFRPYVQQISLQYSV